MPDATSSQWVATFAKADLLPVIPDVIDVRSVVPPNPPEEIQLKFVGYSYEDAFTEAESFVAVSDQFAAKHGRGSFSTLDRIVDFGSGWGRISRYLLTLTSAPKIFAIDVDSDMTALINTTLPGVNAMTIDPDPPTALRTASMDAAVAFSVFSHLSGPAHEAWAAELGRIVVPGGTVAITVLDGAFFDQIQSAQTAVANGAEDAFSASLATTFPDLVAARAGYADGQIQYAGSGGGEVRTGDYYGWAAAPTDYIGRVWGQAGFTVVEWVPSGVLFAQALICLVRQPDPVVPSRAEAAISRARGVAGRAVRGAAAAVRNRRNGASQS